MISKFWDARAARVMCTILVFAACLAFLHEARDTLTLFLFAVLFAYFVAPLVSRLQKPLRGRTQAIGMVYLLLIALLVGLGFLVGPKIAEESRSLSTSLPTLIDKMGSGALLSQVSEKHGWSEARQEQIRTFFFAHKDELLQYGKALGVKIAQPAQHIWWLLIIPILSLFFLKDGQSMAEGIIDIVPSGEDRAALRGIIGDVNVMLGSYIRAQFILASLTLVIYTLVLSVMRVPYAFILGPLAGVFEFVPIVGPAVAAVTIFGIAALSGYPHMVWLVIFLGVWRLLQDYVNGPRIMGASLEISPVIQIFSVLAGGEIAGVVGALVSVPVVAILRILWRRMSSGRSVDAELVDPLPISHSTSSATERTV